MNLITLTPDHITDDNVRDLALPLLRAQAQFTAGYVVDEVNRWSVDFVSDDGQDYVTAALDLCSTLTYIAYEGNARDLNQFLFQPSDSDEPCMLTTTVNIAACDGVCPELAKYWIDS